MIEKSLKINVASMNAFVRVFEESIDAPNIIYLMTPIVSVKDKLATP